jgi:hypothetical protein
MLTLRTLRHVATSRTIASFRSAPSPSLGTLPRLGDAGRIGHHRARTQAEEIRRQWLQRQWRP